MGWFDKLVVASMPLIPKGIIKRISQKYIAGALLDDAVRVTRHLNSIGATATIDVLGEFVSSKDRAVHETATSASVVDAIRSHKLNAYLSIKLTSLGLDIDKEFAFENVRTIVTRARAAGVFVRMDMENTPYTDITLDFYRRLRTEGFTNVGVVIQAYLHRSEADIRSLLEFRPDVRLCKGIYVESETVAFKNREEIRSNYKKLLRLLITNGAMVRIATHDEPLIQDAVTLIHEQNILPQDYQFQMLLGVREDRRDTLIKAGHPMGIYVPFGDDWYGYSTRRLKENPQIAGYVAKALFTGK